MKDKSSKSFLMVTFPVDLGNRTYESNFQSLLGADCDFYRFAADHAGELEQGIDRSRNFKDRIRGAVLLRKTVRQACSDGKKILFHGISPALFSYGSWKQSQTCILLDWTRCLYPRTLGIPVRKDFAWALHHKVLRSARRILCLTEAARESVVNDYQINPDKACVVPAPFELESLKSKPRPTPPIARFLFIGGDLKRKGGDLLLKAASEGRIPPGILTMVTNDKVADIPQVNFRPGIRFGTPEHKKLFETHDVLILPTTIDSYPQAIGEAAMAGLMVITTRFALGAPHIIQNGISGLITENPASAVAALVELMANPSRIDSMKTNIHVAMHANFSRERIVSSYLTAPWT